MLSGSRCASFLGFFVAPVDRATSFAGRLSRGILSTGLVHCLILYCAGLAVVNKG